VLSGDNLDHRADLADSTVRLYLTAAVDWLRVHAGCSIRIFHRAEGRQQQDKLDPYLAQLLQQRRIWQQRRPKREPCSSAMFDAMADHGEHAYARWSLVDTAAYRLGPYGMAWHAGCLYRHRLRLLRRHPSRAGTQYGRYTPRTRGLSTHPVPLR